MKDEDLVYTVAEAAVKLRCHPNHVRSMIRAGELPHTRLRRRVVIPVARLKQWVADNTQGGSCDDTPASMGSRSASPR